MNTNTKPKSCVPAADAVKQVAGRIDAERVRKLAEILRFHHRNFSSQLRCWIDIEHEIVRRRV